jgi:hypothetical protein
MVSKLDKDPILISIWCDQISNEKTLFFKLEIQTMCNQSHDFKGIVEEMKNISSTIEIDKFFPFTKGCRFLLL